MEAEESTDDSDFEVLVDEKAGSESGSDTNLNADDNEKIKDDANVERADSNENKANDENTAVEKDSVIAKMTTSEENKMYPQIYDLDIESLEEKPWRNLGADITDYFNYGFTEESWRAYCARQVQMRTELRIENNKRAIEKRALSRKHKRRSNSSLESYSSYSEETEEESAEKRKEGDVPRYKRKKHR